MSTQQDMSAMQFRQRPCGVMLMVIFLFLQGIFMLIAGIFGIFGLVVLVFNPSQGGALLTHGIIYFTLGILSIAFSIGMFLLKPWAFWAAITIAAFNLVVSLIVLVQTGFTSWGHFFNAIFSLVVLLYFLTDNDVRAAFLTTTDTVHSL